MLTRRSPLQQYDTCAFCVFHASGRDTYRHTNVPGTTQARFPENMLKNEQENNLARPCYQREGPQRSGVFQQIASYCLLPPEINHKSYSVIRESIKIECELRTDFFQFNPIAKNIRSTVQQYLYTRYEVQQYPAAVLCTAVFDNRLQLTSVS